MTGDANDILARLNAALPTRWFPDASPVLTALLTGLANAWSALYALIVQLRLQSRITTATGATLDTVTEDFFADRLPRRSGEADDSFRARIQQALVAEHATRAALAASILHLTGNAPTIFEPARPADTGSYAGPALGYGVAGAWGSLVLPFQAFVTIRRPAPPGIAIVAGYETGGPLARANLAQSGSQITDSDINAAIVSVLPTACIAGRASPVKEPPTWIARLSIREASRSILTYSLRSDMPWLRSAISPRLPLAAPPSWTAWPARQQRRPASP